LFGGLVDRQPLANDEADGGPVEDRLHTSLSFHATPASGDGIHGAAVGPAVGSHRNT
jgi:hypothetical protein